MKNHLTFTEKFLDKFAADDTTTLAASLACYTALSLAPLLLLFVTISSHLSPRLQQLLITDVRGLVGIEAAESIETILRGATGHIELTSLASLTGLLTLLISASLIFGQMRSTLNRIFSVSDSGPIERRPLPLLFRFLKERLLHVGLAVSFVFTLTASLLASSALSAVEGSDHLLLMILVNVFASVLFYVVIFTVIFRYLPDGRRPWLWAAEGGGLTAVLFVVGKELIGAYLGKSAVGSAYGTAGSVIVLLLWVYYSALITFIGAQVSSLLHPAREGAT